MNNPIKKQAEDLSKKDLPKKICRWQVSIGKDAPHHVVRELHIRTMRYHYTPNRRAKIQTLTPPYAVGSKMAQTLPKITWQFLKKLKVPYDPAITFFSIYLNELKTYVHTKTRT